MKSDCIAFLGLGRMGAPMARNLAQAGYRVRAWNRTPQCWSDLPDNLRIVPRAEDALEGARAAIFMLTDGRALSECLFDRNLVRCLPVGAVVIDMSTGGPRAALESSRRLSSLGIEFADAPVSGGVKGAELAKLTILVGATAATMTTVRPILETLGAAHHLGGIGCGQAAKLANQMMVAGYIAAVAEGVRFAEALGIDPLTLVRSLEGGFADSAILRQHGLRMATRDFRPGGTCRLHLKDLQLVADAAASDFQHFTSTREAMRRFEQLVNTERADLDHSAYYLTYAESRS